MALVPHALSPRLTTLGPKVRAGTAALRTAVSLSARGQLTAAPAAARRTYDSFRTVEGNGRLENATTQLARIAALNPPGPKAPVTIVGAGMAGLAAAHELKRLGYPVHILEGSDRVGGRIWTHRFEDGSYHELGAMRIPAQHSFTRHYVNELRLQLRKFVTVNGSPNALHDIDGTVSRMGDAPEALYPRFGVDAFELETRPPGEVLPHHLGQVLQTLSKTERESLFGVQLASSRLARWDRTTVRELLLERGVSPQMLELMAASAHMQQQLADPVTTQLRARVQGLSEGLEEIVGGMDQLPRGLAAGLGSEIEFNAKLLGLRNLRNGKVELTVSRGGGVPQTEVHDRVLMTLPFTVLRELETPTFKGRKQAVVDQMPYQSATKVLLHSPGRVWEEEGIFGGTSISNGGTGFTYYPSDNAGARDPSVTAAGGALLGSYTQAGEARRLGALSPEALHQTVIDEVSRLHPGIQLDATKSVVWDEEPWARGAFALQTPGRNEMGKQALKPQGNLHFAGDHTTQEPGWINGALASALRAVEEIVTERPRHSPAHRLADAVRTKLQR